MEIFIGILGIVWGILCIKIWKACNHIELLANKFAANQKENKAKFETREEIDNWLKEEH